MGIATALKKLVIARRRETPTWQSQKIGAILSVFPLAHRNPAQAFVGARPGGVHRGGRLECGSNDWTAPPLCGLFLSSSFCPNKKNLPPEGDTLSVAALLVRRLTIPPGSLRSPTSLYTREAFHLIRHGFAVPPSPQGEGFFHPSPLRGAPLAGILRRAFGLTPVGGRLIMRKNRGGTEYVHL